MRKTYIQPDIWVEKLIMESPLLGESNKLTNVTGADLRYAGGGSEAARVGENHLWDEENDVPGWDQW